MSEDPNKSWNDGWSGQAPSANADYGKYLEGKALHDINEAARQSNSGSGSTFDPMGFAQSTDWNPPQFTYAGSNTAGGKVSLEDFANGIGLPFAIPAILMTMPLMPFLYPLAGIAATAAGWVTFTLWPRDEIGDGVIPAVVAFQAALWFSFRLERHLEKVPGYRPARHAWRLLSTGVFLQTQMLGFSSLMERPWPALVTAGLVHLFLWRANGARLIWRAVLVALRMRQVTAAVVLVAVLLTSTMAARSAAAQIKPAPAPTGPAFSTAPCRTFDTSVTSVTAGGPMKATVEWTGGFDPYSLRFVQNINFSSNQGARFSYVQVTTYPTAEDFIAEIVRIKPPATLATNPNGPILNIIPPLTRSRSTVGNGAIALSKTNTHDTNGRLTGFTARSSGGTITMRYSAWDALGRPTAGSIQSPAGPSTQTIAYDDKAMSMTETTTSKGLVSTMTYTYDQSGNLRSTVSSITRGQPTTTTVTSHSSDTVCLGDIIARRPLPPKPAGPNPAGTFTGTIGGQSWSAALGLIANNTGGVVSVGGGDKRYTVSIGLTARPGLGEYKAGSIADEDFTKMTQGQFTDAIDRNSVVATVTDTVTRQSWMASPTLGTGTVSLTSVVGAAAGTFSLTLEPVPGTGASGSINFSGTFNIKF